jgi:hypothetical protein
MQKWENFSGLPLLDAILASPIFELQEATGLGMKTLEFMRKNCTDDQYVVEIFRGSSKSPVEIATVLAGYEPWKFGFSDEEMEG